MALFVGEGPAVRARAGFAWGRVGTCSGSPSLPGVGPRLLRPHVGAVRVLGPGPVPGRAARSRKSRTVAGNIWGDRGRGARLCGRRANQPRPRKSAGRPARLGRFGGVLCCPPPCPTFRRGRRSAMLAAWGFFVVADSPQFSAMSAKACPPDAIGSALAVQNSIGFLITVFSIQLTAGVWDELREWTPWIWRRGRCWGSLRCEAANQPLTASGRREPAGACQCLAPVVGKDRAAHAGRSPKRTPRHWPTPSGDPKLMLFPIGADPLAPGAATGLLEVCHAARADRYQGGDDPGVRRPGDGRPGHRPPARPLPGPPGPHQGPRRVRGRPARVQGQAAKNATRAERGHVSNSLESKRPQEAAGPGHPQEGRRRAAAGRPRVQARRGRPPRTSGRS